MINNDMRLYNFSTLGGLNEYGQQIDSGEVKGQIKMAINVISQAIADNIRYKDAQYIGLTNCTIDDTYTIHYGEERLKVLYVNSKGRYKQVFMKNK